MFSALPEPAVLIPTTFPFRSSKGPPEFPGLMAASVWMTSLYLRPPPGQTVRVQFGSWALITRPSAETMPLETVGPPFRASAYPIAMTRSPRSRSLEFPRGTVGRPVVSIFRIARSALWSPPITRAW